MGQHTLRRASGISTTTGRAIFTGIAALGLVSGGAGMAFAGEASGYSSDHDDKGDHDEGDHDGHDEGDHDGHGKDDDGHGKKHHEKHHHQHHTKPASCEIPVTTPIVEEIDAFDEDLTDDALKPANDASTALTKPVEDAVCPVVVGELNSLDDDLGHGPQGDEKMLGTSPTGL